MLKKDWNLSNVPPKDDPDAAEFAMQLFDAAKAEKDRLGKHDDFRNNFALYKNKSRDDVVQGRMADRSKKAKTKNLVNLYFANVERTVSNITARSPVGEVVDLDGKSLIEQETGITDESILSMQIKKWWKETSQQQKTRTSARQMEIYGITPERPHWDKDKDRPDITPTDPFCIFPAPGNWDNPAEEAPYFCFAYVGYVSLIEDFYGKTEIAEDNAYDLLGLEREKYKGNEKTSVSIGNYSEPMTISAEKEVDAKALKRCLVIEVWIRDNRTRSEKIVNPIMNEATGEQAADPLTGEPLFEEITQKTPVYRDGIRKITITKTKDPAIKSGVVVLDDSENPNLNPALPDELARTTYPWGKIPVYYANSYKDGMSMWGFSAAEQVGDLLQKLNILFNKMILYVLNVLVPPLIIQKNCGITREMIINSIESGGRLILMPTIPNARIEFMQIPNLPETFFRVLELLIMFFDRVYQIEDADRGNAPKGIIAASAIVALQERNQMLMQSKVVAIDYLAEERTKWAIGLYQNFGTRTEFVNVGDQPIPFTGFKFAGRNFNYVVESGSTTPRTSLQRQELAFQLYQQKAIGQRGLLEAINWPNWKEELERTAESQLDQALQILIEAGLPEEEAVALRQFLLSSSVQTQQNEAKKRKEVAA